MSGKTFFLIPGFRATSYTTEDFSSLLSILQKYNVSELKFTSTRRLAVVGPSKIACSEIGRELESLFPPIEKSSGWITYIQACPGRDACKYGLKSGDHLRDLIEKIELPSPLQAKIKIGIAGCRMCCTEPMVRDIGLIAENRGWKLIFGGNAGGRARVGDIIADGLTDEQAVELIRKCLNVYQAHAAPKMRTARFIESFGAEKFIKTVCCDIL